MSVVDTLRKYGKWIESKKFIALAEKEIGKSERQIYRDIKKAVQKREILKIALQNRTVLYGLAEFGAPPSLSNIIVFYGEKEDLDFIDKMTARELLEEIEDIKKMDEFFKNEPKDSIIKVYVINGKEKKEGSSSDNNEI